MTHCDRTPGSYVEAYDKPIELRAVHGDLDHQERLCNQLLACKAPLFNQVINIQQFPAEMARLLGVPLAAMSFGPCAEDKIWLNEKQEAPDYSEAS